MGTLLGNDKERYRQYKRPSVARLPPRIPSSAIPKAGCPAHRDIVLDGRQGLVIATPLWMSATTPTRFSSACALAVLALLYSGACRQTPASRSAAKPEVSVASAANLTDVFQQIGPEFERASGIHPVFSFASTAQLAQQIENSAPYDLIAAADASHVAELDKRGLLLPGSRAVYAIGILALWIPPRGPAVVERLEDLCRPEVHVIAVAKPELAPYGQATVDTLRALGVWDRVKSKIVYAENISMAKQYGASNNADAVFTAYSLVVKGRGKVIPVGEGLHRPIAQELGIVAGSKHAEAARKFAEFLLSGRGRDILAESGYRLPQS
jgi:molybdate transport system substrate-binding protein